MKVNKENKFILRTRKIDSYFTGRIVFFDGEWQVTCSSYSGGDVPILSILDYRGKTKKIILEKIDKFKKKHKLITTP